MEDKWKTILDESINGLRYGSIEIVIHDGRITQIERRERFRTIPETSEAPSHSNNPRRST